MSLLEILAVVGIDILLSGDNAVIIALAARQLPAHLQKRVIFYGMLGAILLRILAATLLINLLDVSFVQAIGGIILFRIAYQLIVQRSEEHDIKSSTHFWGAVQIIIISDLAMSFDNIIALSSVAHGVTPIILGILISIPIIIFGSQFLLKVIEKFPFIIYVGSGLLIFAAGKMILNDKGMDFFMNAIPEFYYLWIQIALAVLVVAIGFVRNRIKDISINL